MKEITNEWLKEKNACMAGIAWFNDQKETDTIKVLNKLMAEDKFKWANWTIVRILDYKQLCQYAVFAAEQVLDIFEKKYPDDKSPRNAIKAAKKYIDNPNEANKKEVYASAHAAYAAADVAAKVVYVAYAAVYAAYAAAHAAYAAANAAAEAEADAAANAAAEAEADAAAYAAKAAEAEADAAAYATANAAYAAAYAAKAAAYAAADAAAEAVCAAGAETKATKKDLQNKIIEYGIGLLKEVK